MNKQLISSYAKMISDGLCSLSDLPEDYRQPVDDYINNSDPSVGNDDISENVSSNIQDDSINGALYLGKVEKEISVEAAEHGHFDLTFDTDTIFRNYTDQSCPYPVNPRYSLGLIENTSGKYSTAPNVTVYTIETGFRLEVNGIASNVVSGSRLLRVDVKCTASNYEEMRYTVYIVAK